MIVNNFKENNNKKYFIFTKENTVKIQKMILKYTISKSILKRVLSLNNSRLTLGRRTLSSGKVITSNVDTHRPEQIQQKWYNLWQSKLKEFNKQVRILT